MKSKINNVIVYAAATRGRPKSSPMPGIFTFAPTSSQAGGRDILEGMCRDWVEGPAADRKRCASSGRVGAGLRTNTGTALRREPASRRERGKDGTHYQCRWLQGT